MTFSTFPQALLLRLGFIDFQIQRALSRKPCGKLGKVLYGPSENRACEFRVEVWAGVGIGWQALEKSVQVAEKVSSPLKQVKD
jgi:hypothetical protein